MPKLTEQDTKLFTRTWMDCHAPGVEVTDSNINDLAFYIEKAINTAFDEPFAPFDSWYETWIKQELRPGDYKFVVCTTRGCRYGGLQPKAQARLACPSCGGPLVS